MPNSAFSLNDKAEWNATATTGSGQGSDERPAADDLSSCWQVELHLLSDSSGKSNKIPPRCNFPRAPRPQFSRFTPHFSLFHHLHYLPVEISQVVHRSRLKNFTSFSLGLDDAITRKELCATCLRQRRRRRVVLSIFQRVAHFTCSEIHLPNTCCIVCRRF